MDHAKNRLEQILGEHKISKELTKEQEENVENILHEARNYYRKKGMISDEEWELYMRDLESPNYPYA